MNIMKVQSVNMLLLKGSSFYSKVVSPGCTPSALLAAATLLARPLPAAVKVFVCEKTFTKNGKGLFSLPETKRGR
ncbi:hypothetical protein [Geobacillus thermoleovorans]|uniref:hypothetical protein n=1 Tax=Geobacillus thermoleovorans TaxID=33941 RepID=UPI003DA26D37